MNDATRDAIAQAGLAERTHKRRVKAAAGMPLIDDLQNLRMEAGKEMLETTNVAVDEISAEVGYSDASFFRRLFKRLVGLTPVAYRRLFGGQQLERPACRE